jgi:hypothetical protein
VFGSSTRSGSPPPPPTTGGTEVDLRIPQAAVGKSFAAYVFFTLFNRGGFGPPGSGFAFSFLFPALGAAIANQPSLASSSGPTASVTIGSTPPKGAALGATKNLTSLPGEPHGSAADWLWYVIAGGAVFLVAALALLALQRRRGPPASA